MSMQESKWHRPCTHKEQTPISIIAVQDFTRHLMGASSAALCSAFCFVLQGFEASAMTNLIEMLQGLTA